MRRSEEILQKQVHGEMDAEGSGQTAKNLLAEWRQDHAMAVERDATREGAGMSPGDRENLHEEMESTASSTHQRARHSFLTGQWPKHRLGETHARKYGRIS
jgi:hypothetical protein